MLEPFFDLQRYSGVKSTPYLSGQSDMNSFRFCPKQFWFNSTDFYNAMVREHSKLNAILRDIINILDRRKQELDTYSILLIAKEFLDITAKSRVKHQENYISVVEDRREYI